MIGYLFEYIQNAINLAFVACFIHTDSYGLDGRSGNSLAAVILSTAINDVFAKSIYRGLNNSMCCLVSQA